MLDIGGGGGGGDVVEGVGGEGEGGEGEGGEAEGGEGEGVEGEGEGGEVGSGGDVSVVVMLKENTPSPSRKASGVSLSHSLEVGDWRKHLLQPKKVAFLHCCLKCVVLLV